ncbi:MAG: outer membrane lipoprotein carrier protein LolA [Deltaproteobacteria bacterium]|nr:outer membrane lipoprotein carrier protein LolA [Deltaproteobacteria bacterium]
MDFKGKNRFFSLTPFHVLPGTVRLVAVWCMAACIALFSCGWCAEEPGSKPKVSEGDVFSRISISVKNVHTMTSAFEQERRTAMLKDAMISKGRFFFAKPDKIRWETTDPVSAGFSVNGQEARRWQGTSEPPEKIVLSEAPFLQVLIQQIVAWTSADFTSLKERYDLKVISEDPVTLGLVPLMAGERDYVGQVTLVFSPDLTYVTSVKIQEKKGDEVIIRFFNAVINEPIAEERF